MQIADSGKMDLSGHWKLRWADGQRGGLDHHVSEFFDEAKWMEATVPGEIHLDLMRAGIISDPSEGLNFLSSRWVEENFWTYRRTFEVPEELLQVTSWLYFEGLDYTAKIFLNQEEVAHHANFFLPCRIEVSGKLKQGINTLVVQLESGLFEVGNKSVNGYFVTHLDSNLHKRIWLRKPQSSFGWDWSTRLLNVGIYKPVWLEWASEVRMGQIVILTDVEENLANAIIQTKLHVEVVSVKSVPGQVRIRVPEANCELSKEIDFVPGTDVIELGCQIPNPNLWWPVGQGAQPLYTVEVELWVNGVVIGRNSKKVGFRRVRINQDKHPENGNYFTIEINNRPIFAKGANFVPADMIFARIDRQRYETLIDRALEANFNMLRVWGGGLYESDDFYELCDQHGIMVWQEFIFACANYPASDKTFLENVQSEAVYQVRRLASHPSLIVWCGNNEIEWLTWEPQSEIVHPDYALFHDILPRIVGDEDPTRYYHPSSPYSPNHEFPNDDHVGDQHPWSIGFENVDFREYRSMSCRFPNEGGILGPTSLPTMHASLPKGQKFVNSFAWQHHDNGVEQWFAKSAPDRVVSEWLNLSPREMTIEEFTYYGGLVQGEGLREYIDNFRRRMFDTSSAVFWMFNDCWPATRSWTIIDYYLNRTPSYHPVRRAFSPVSVVVTKENEQINIYGINDRSETWVGDLRYGVFDFAGKYPIDQTKTVSIPKNSSICLASFSYKEWEKTDINQSLAFALLVSESQIVSRNRLILPRFYEMKWIPAEIEVIRDGEELVFFSNSFAWGVCLDLDGREYLPDNFFDLWPGMEYRFYWPMSKQIPEIIKIGNLYK